MKTQISSKWNLLRFEGHLLQGSLKTGLNALRDAHLGIEGAYYAAFFQLSIGLERLMKVILLIDHMARNDLAVPDKKTLKNYGHELDTLFESVKTLPDPSPNPLADIKSDSIHTKLIDFLAKFAIRARYHNLDTLVGAAAATATDPLDDWKVILRAIYKEIPTHSKKAYLEPLAGVRYKQDIAVVTGKHRDESGMVGTDGVIDAAVEHHANRYASRHILEIIDLLRDVLESAVGRAHTTQDRLIRKSEDVPFMDEFLECFPRNRGRMLSKNHYGWY